MPPPAYTRRLSTLPNVIGTEVSDAVPDGLEWVVLCCTAYYGGEGAGEITVGTDRIFFWFVVLDAPSGHRSDEWQGRVVLRPGERLQVTTGTLDVSSGGIDFQASGYVLTQ